MSTFLEADELVCRINVYDPKEVSDFFVALGGSVVDSAGQKGNGESTLKVGEGLISILKSANHNYFYPEMSVQMNKADQSIWTSRFESQLDSKVRSKTKLEINSPSGPRFSFNNQLIQLRNENSDQVSVRNEGSVLHFQITWWSKKWLDDYTFLSEKLGLATSRGRSEPEGSRIAFLRAANSGRSILEIVDGLYDQHEGPELHWLISLVVDDAEIFHERLISTGQPVSSLGFTSWNALSFTAKTSSGPLLFVYQERPNGTPGMVGSPAGLD